MTVETMSEPDGVPADEPYEPSTGGAAVDARVESVAGLRQSATSVPAVGQGYARAVSGNEDPPSADAGDSAGPLSWVRHLPEDDRILFAEEMSERFAEAAATDDFEPVEQDLREWCVTAEAHADPELSRLLGAQRAAAGDCVTEAVA